ncbi:archaeal proteasome endopeptidase complex subunit beta [Pyrofollis japonicus]|uniref:archaeal proteasome endopeptidase complex subunit beta n=1 Tax=Pyrofollis japonicus TaxID=3060460 RepID=UPI00295AD146|nr:archaeal proteasome endopeptidase complex subunit beta [Pyrofollis japonicus]BEP18054.1 archaeal proteasome endopeptidase complex subunit beta [Pyrofollis japonicus]
MSYHEYGIGATALGVRGKDYVILAAERRVSYGGFVASKAGKKVYKITDYLGLALAGLFADIQALTKLLKANIDYYNLVVGKRMSVRAAAKLLATILYSNKYFPFFSETLVGGIDVDGNTRLYVMDPLGSLIEDDFAAIGSGAPIAIGVLEARFKPDMSFDDAKKIVMESIRAAIERDALSGDGIDILSIRRINEERIIAEEESHRLF